MRIRKTVAHRRGKKPIVRFYVLFYTRRDKISARQENVFFFIIFFHLYISYYFAIFIGSRGQLLYVVYLYIYIYNSSCRFEEGDNIRSTIIITLVGVNCTTAGLVPVVCLPAIWPHRHVVAAKFLDL